MLVFVQPVCSRSKNRWPRLVSAMSWLSWNHQHPCGDSSFSYHSGGGWFPSYSRVHSSSEHIKITPLFLCFKLIIMVRSRIQREKGAKGECRQMRPQHWLPSLVSAAHGNSANICEFIFLLNIFLPGLLSCHFWGVSRVNVWLSSQCTLASMSPAVNTWHTWIQHGSDIFFSKNEFNSWMNAAVAHVSDWFMVGLACCFLY